MNHKIRKLLKQKKLTGQEFGNALIITRVQEIINGDQILTGQELKFLSSKVAGQSETEKGAAYVNFFTWIERYFVIAQVYQEKFYVGYTRLFLRLFYTIEVEQSLHKLRELTAGSYTTIDDNYQKLLTLSTKSLSNVSIFADLDTNEVVQFMQDGRDTIRENLIKLLAYNKAVDLFTSFLKIPNFSQVFKINMELMVENVALLNDKIVLLKNLSSGFNEEMEKRYQFLDKVYPLTNVTDYEPPPEAIEEVSGLIEEAILTTKPYQIIRILQKNL